MFCQRAFVIRTSLLLLQGHLVPVNLHTIPELHEQIGLFLRRHTLPALLDTGERGVGNGMFGGGTGLLSSYASHWSGSGPDSRAASSLGSGANEHCALEEKQIVESNGG